MIIVTHIGQTGAGRAFGSVKGLRVRARKSRCTLKIKSERTNVWKIPTTRSDWQIEFRAFDLHLLRRAFENPRLSDFACNEDSRF